MKPYCIDLLDFFDEKTKEALISFCKKVNESDADVFVTMAHKAVLLYDVLKAQGYICDSKKRIIVTNFSLSFDTSYIAGKKIAILDDIVISGTSIASIVNKLLDLGVRSENIEVFAIAIDKAYFSMRFLNQCNLNYIHCDYVMEDDICIEISSNISKIFSFYGEPYDVDFPVYENIIIEKDQLNHLRNNLFWEAFDVSNLNHKSNNIIAYTLFPTQHIRRCLWSDININLENCVDIKLRLFLKTFPDETTEATIVPICLFNEINTNDLDAIFNIIKPKGLVFGQNESHTSISKIRYLEFHIAHHLYKVFSSITSIGMNIVFGDNITCRLFGPLSGKKIYSSLFETPSQETSSQPIHINRYDIDYSDLLEDYKQSDIFKLVSKKELYWDEGTNYQKGCWLNQLIFSPFLWWRESKEIPARNDIKEKKLHSIYDREEINHYLLRLKNGLPVNLLDTILKEQIPGLSQSERRHTISTFLDRAIDEGIIVPTIHYNEKAGYICRAYRHGEDLPFGIADQYRLVYFVHCFGTFVQQADQKGKNISSISSISFEKIIVLFYQMGMKKGNIFNRFLGFDNIEIIHSFLSVHGTIAGYTAPKEKIRIFSERNNHGDRYITWLTTWLTKNGFIEIISEDERRINLNATDSYLEANNRSTLSEMIKESIESFAEMIAKWYCNMANENQKIEFRDQATALTSCSNRFVYASAIATEIHYFNHYWLKQASQALDKPYNSHSILSYIANSEEGRKYTPIIVQALHSGREKVKWRDTNKAQVIINEVKKYLDPTSKVVWSQIWNDIDVPPRLRSDDFELYTNMSIGFLYFFSACLECLRSNSFWLDGEVTNDYLTYKSEYNKMASTCKLLEPGLFDELDRIASVCASEMRKKAHDLYQYVLEVLKSSEDCVDEIERFVRDEDPTYTVEYVSALVIDLEPIDTRQMNDAFLELWYQYNGNQAQTELNIVRIPQTSDSCIKYGIFWGEVKKPSLDRESIYQNKTFDKYGDFLLDAFQRLLSLLEGKLCSAHGILLPHLRPISYFKHNLQCNIANNASIFYQDVIKPFEVAFDTCASIQLVFGLDRSVTKEFQEKIAKQVPPNICKKFDPPQDAQWCASCIWVKENHLVHCNADDLMSRITYSQIFLQTRNGDVLGTGLLFRSNDRILCISCNHLFEDVDEEKLPIAASIDNPNYMFELKPISELISYKENNELLPSNDEICVFLPKWNGHIPYEISKLISFSDCMNAAPGANCTCSRYMDGSLTWTSEGKVKGPLPKGYFQIDIEEKELADGCSGGIYVTYNETDGNKLIGIHEGRFLYDGKTSARMIPWQSIQEKLKKIREGYQ